MFSYFRERHFKLGDRCKVYRNLNNQQFSIMAMNGQFKGKVVAHADSVTLKNVNFKVSMASKNRAIRLNTRNVHAFSIGTIVSVDDQNNHNKETLNPISYRPFELPYFFNIGDMTPIHNCSELYLNNGKAYTERNLKALNECCCPFS